MDLNDERQCMPGGGGQREAGTGGLTRDWQNATAVGHEEGCQEDLNDQQDPAENINAQHLV